MKAEFLRGLEAYAEMLRLAKPLEGLLVSPAHLYDTAAPFNCVKDVTKSYYIQRYTGWFPATHLATLIHAHRPVTQADIDAILARIKSEAD